MLYLRRKRQNTSKCVNGGVESALPQSCVLELEDSQKAPLVEERRELEANSQTYELQESRHRYELEELRQQHELGDSRPRYEVDGKT
jgi:hypothetical protein